MSGYSIVARISFGLAALTLSILFLSYLFGLLPDNYRTIQQARTTLVESTAVSVALAAQKDDMAAIKIILSALIQRDKTALSAGVRSASGKLIVDVADHEKHWQINKVNDNSLTQIAVPIFQDKNIWGSLEIQFNPIEGTSQYTSLLNSAVGIATLPIMRLVLFVGLIAFIAYIFYMRRVLKHLDPSAVIPERVQAMLNTLSEGVIVLDTNGQIVLSNDAFSRTLSLAPTKLLGMNASHLDWQLLANDNDAIQLKANEYPWDRILEGKDRIERNIGLRLSHSDGNAHVFKVNATPITGGDSKIRGVMVTFDDVTALERKNARLNKMLQLVKQSREEIKLQNIRLQELAMHDSLTGCLNRRAFFEILQGAWNSAKRHHQFLGILMIDVDHFKSVNDRYGHVQGDEVLKTIAQILKTGCRNDDYVCRYGGEEFCMMLSFSGIEEAKSTAERYRAEIAAHSMSGLKVTVSLGASSLEQGAQSIEELISQADKALYAAKNGGRNRVMIWDTHLKNTDIPQRVSHLS